jgi:hypothetical protein
MHRSPLLPGRSPAWQAPCCGVLEAAEEDFAVIRAPARIERIWASSDPYVAVTSTPAPGAATCTTWLVVSLALSAPENDAASGPSFTVPGGTDVCSGCTSTAPVRPNARSGHRWSAPGVPR